MPPLRKRPVLVGGPLDGATIAPGPRPGFIYCTEAGVRNGETYATAYTSPDKRGVRLLYRLKGVTDGVEAYVYAGHTMRRCNGCAGYVTVARRRCVFCGHIERRSPVAT